MVYDPEAEAEVDKLLGDKALFSLDSVQLLGGPSRPTINRAVKAGLIEVVRNGSTGALTRATVKRILLKGLGPISFLYGKQGEDKKRALIPPEEGDRIAREGVGSLRPADAPPHGRHRFPRKGSEAA
jgi:hypothetical protein